MKSLHCRSKSRNLRRRSVRTHDHPTAPPHAHRCCSVDESWAWVDRTTELALSGDDTAKEFLPVLIDHVFGAARCLTDWEAELVLAWVAQGQPDHEVQGCRYCGKEFSAVRAPRQKASPGG